MRTVVVYESLFGNTREIADAIGEGIHTADPSGEVTCVGVGEIEPASIGAAELLVVGGPTHMHGMSSGISRRMGLENEHKAGHGDRIDAGASGPGVRDWLHDMPTATRGSRAAAFDTRADFSLAGGAAHGIARRLRRHGYDLVTDPAGFIIEDTTGPLREGEIERAREWGASLARLPVH